MNEDTGLTNTSPNAKRADPKSQAQFDLILGRCRQVMGEASQEWLATLKQDPVQGAVTLGTETLRHMVQSSEQAGQPVDPTVLINVGVQLVKDVAAVANAAGLVPDDQLKGYLKDVMSQSMAEYLNMDAKDGLLSKDDMQRAQQVVGGGQQPGAQPAQPAPGMNLAAMQQGAQP